MEGRDDNRVLNLCNRFSDDRGVPNGSEGTKAQDGTNCRGSRNVRDGTNVLDGTNSRGDPSGPRRIRPHGARRRGPQHV